MNTANNSVKNRLKLFVSSTGLGETAFEDKVGLSRGFVSKDRDSIRESSLSKILSFYPDLNANWLKTGDGEMSRQKPLSQTIEDIGKNVIPSKELWDVIKSQQAIITSQQNTIHKIESLENAIRDRDRQIDEFISMMKEQTESIKKTHAQRENNADFADAK